jgi:DNA-binding NarL/FixJ family response regulator
LLEIFMGYTNNELFQPALAPEEDRDSHGYSSYLSWVWLFKEDSFLNLRCQSGYQDTEGRNWDNRTNGFSANLAMPLFDKVKLQLSGQVTEQDFNHYHTAFNIIREDTIYSFSGGLTWKCLKNATLMIIQGIFIRWELNTDSDLYGDMDLLATQNKETGRLADKTIYIIGHNRLQGELLAFYLEKKADARCIMNKDVSGLLKDKSSQPALILIECPGTDTEQCVNDLQLDKRELTENNPVALFNVTQGHGIEEAAIARGIKGIFYNQDPLSHFQKGISAIYKGELLVSREVLTKYILEDRESNKTDYQDDKLLTQREVEILSMVSVGTKNEDIAEKLNISPNTVKTHIYNIFKKINVPNRLQAALWAAKNL